MKILNQDSWVEFCQLYLSNKLETEWKNQVASRGVSYLDQEHPELVNRKPDWNDLAKLIQTYGIGGSDAMIINFFLCTSLKFIVTADKDVAFCMSKIQSDKLCVIPSSLNL